MFTSCSPSFQRCTSCRRWCRICSLHTIHPWFRTTSPCYSYATYRFVICGAKATTIPMAPTMIPWFRPSELWDAWLIAAQIIPNNAIRPPIQLHTQVTIVLVFSAALSSSVTPEPAAYTSGRSGVPSPSA